MNEKIQRISNLIQQSDRLQEEEKNAILQSLKDADKEISVAAFKIERLEKVKYTTTVLLEQTIEELEAKRKSVEEQKRELEIEAALERVRARTMAMQHSDELSETAYILFQQFRQLGEDPIQITVGILNEEQNRIEFRITGGDGSGSRIDQTFNAGIDEPTLINKLFRAWKEGKRSTVISLEGKELSQWVAYRNKISGQYAYETIVKDDDRRYVAAGFFSKGMLSISKAQAPAEGTIQILEKFASVFDLTYTRFLDLKTAEAQAREARIEAALEKVRSQTMAMYKSSELLHTAHILFDQVRQLGAELQGVAFAICNKDSFTVEKWTSIGVFSHPHDIDPGERRMYEAWKKGIPLYEEVYEGEKQKKYFEAFMKIPAFRNGLQKLIDSGQPIPAWQKNHAVSFQYGYLLFITTKPFEETSIFLRFGKVFEQTYTRFLDLQKAETQAREAQIEAAMEKVRARAMSMQKPDELVEVARLLRKEMGLLGVEELETSSIYIQDESTGKTECWYAIMKDLEEEKKLVSDQMTIDLNDTWVGRQMLAFYQSEQRQVSIVMKGAARKEWINYCAQHSDVLVGFYGETIPDRTYHLCKFVSGYIGAASPGDISAESWNLLQRATLVFSLAYTRFSDLQQAEAHALQAEQDLIEIKAARKKAEDTLRELKATQAQLIQSEKMASLGELTAGIAHEIQNPLNFVNNFAEINTELVDELNNEIEKGNIGEVKLLAADLRDNNDKIVFHGKRAESIVKGMLQHSRASTGKKELADINALADEFLRLSYHGLRAKDKTFNAILETHFDASIDRISVSPQDLGRVLLNLFNNAFYAVNEKKKLLNGAYEPVVQVTTAKNANCIEIRVRDNGTGIPERVLDKIYQPFFTTKPTGEGTGLGLSLSYDIITKGHGGEMKVETKEGEGSEFIIQFPIDNTTA